MPQPTGRRSAGAAFAFGTGAAIAWNNALLPRLSARGRPLRSGGRAAATLVFGVVTAAAIDGVRSARTTGWAAGSPSPAALAGVVAGVWGLTNVRSIPREHPPTRAGVARWVLVEIPLGTAVPEEMLFRGALARAAVAAVGEPWGSALAAAAFGLWHVGAARSAGQRPAVIVGATAAAGLVLSGLVRGTGRVWPAAAAHSAVNGIGAILTTRSGLRD
ncbi:CPBP family intramembrane glutamic endopeptidase [Tsukamurella soli]|uniref:CAAX prenyl protease 2/Lysostaphin resistance protein A-like domain-containing protein n=1 Tax=Tsukamurella soli TaxID=644556 RepID=A0ABP8J3H5_9ACTN